MRVGDLDLRELLSFEPQGGIVRFGGERALILDAVALGLLRSELVRTLGRPARAASSPASAMHMAGALQRT